MELFPVIEMVNGKPEIKGFCERRFVHKHRLLHATSLIIPVLSFAAGRILTVDKCEKYISNAAALGDPPPIAQLSVDIFGGHINFDDLSEDERKKGTITTEIMKRNAVNRLSERLFTGDGDKRTPIEVNDWKMKFVGIYECNHTGNNELGYVFTYDMSDMPANQGYTSFIEIDIPEMDEPKIIKLEVIEFVMSELLYMNDMLNSGKSSGYKICDGLERILNTGEAVYKATGISVPKDAKNADNETAKYVVHTRILVSSRERNADTAVIERAESFYGTKREAEERGKQLLKQQAHGMGLSNSSENSYWIEKGE